MRRFGMSCDNLLAAEIVTSEGDVLRVDEESTPEIMWALRGGPLDLGVVTSFRFRLHPVGPRVRLLMGVYPRQVGVEVNRMLRDQMRDAPPELGLISFYGSLPDDKELPEPVRDRDAIVLLGMYTGPEPDADDVLAPFLEHPDLLADLGGWMDYTEAQQALDEEYPDGMRYYWKSLYLDELTEAVLQKLHRLSGEMPSPLSTLDVWSLGGAIDDVDPRTSCFPMRNASHMIAIEANWKSPEDDEANKAWARAVFDELEPHSTGGIYLNFPGDRHERADAAESVYGAAHDRLLRVKRNLDPIGMF
jgi:FAD/FMN-containing dehydrogenase